jgi:hypothetical protein
MQIMYSHDEVYKLNDRYKVQVKDRTEVIEKLTRENDEKMQRMIFLEN